MTVTISKPSFNLREALNSARRKFGIKGTELIRAETTSDVYGSIKPIMFRNKFINGGFDIWQRGTSFGASPGFTADRWSSQANPTGSTVTRESFAAGDATVPGNPKYFYRLTIGSVETAAADRVVIRHMVEDYQQFLGRWVVLSGWYRLTATITGMNWLFQMKRSSGFYDNATEQADTAGALQPANEWRYFERRVFVSASALSGQTMTSTASFGVMLYYQAVQKTGVIDFANLQLELDQATPFEYRPEYQELQLCQRYFQAIGGQVSYQRFGMGYLYSSTGGYFTVPYKVTMRAAPSLSYNGTFRISNGSGSNPAVTSLSVDQSGNDIMSILVAYSAASGYNAGLVASLEASNDSQAKLFFSSEL